MNKETVQIWIVCFLNDFISFLLDILYQVLESFFACLSDNEFFTVGFLYEDLESVYSFEIPSGC